tara:strand:+ start:119 stop:451 length:333 start_codon:yes stop_codon:yes gene_type:complete
MGGRKLLTNNLDPVNQLLAKWEKSSFLKLKKLRKEIKAEHRFHQKKYDFTNVSRAPLEGWGRTTLRESAKKANKYFKYRELLKESLSDAESIVQIIKGLDSLFEWEENEK